jgi:glycosyltransferase involved in cell wall biosynthesis
MHVVESLDAGGAERMAVNLANLTPRERYRIHVCTTKGGGPLESVLAADVGRLCLECRGGFDNLRAMRSLRRYIRRHDIHILHAHGWSLFAARIAAYGLRSPKLVWHDHFGRHDLKERSRWLYGWAARRVSCIPNFISAADVDAAPADVPGTAGARIVCVANFRAQKDHLTLVRAMADVIRQAPHAHLLLVGGGGEADCRRLAIGEIERRGLRANVTWLGQRMDVPSILRACDIGVLSSSSEGLPLALIEYGVAGLAAVATDVGQCRDILDHGRAGILVAPAEPESLAASLTALLESQDQRSRLGERLRQRVQQLYCPAAVVPRICEVYESVLNRNGQ